MDSFATKIVILMLLFLTSILLSLFYFIKKSVTFIKSSIDKKYYIVRNEKTKYQAADLLAKLRFNMIKLSEYMYKNTDKNNTYYPYITTLHDKIYNVKLEENPNSDKYTSYSVNKGEQIIMCLRNKETNEFHTENLLMYVLLHELAHIACPEYNHTPLFVNIYKYFINQSINLGIYQNINFDIDNIKYCGMDLKKGV